jgi:hypothetical protein
MDLTTIDGVGLDGFRIYHMGVVLVGFNGGVGLNI